MTTRTRAEALTALEDALDSDFLRALAEPARVAIIRVLIVGGAMDIGEIAAELPQERSVVSRHLKTLAGAGLVRVERDGRHRRYTLAPATFVGRLEQILRTTRRCIAVCCPAELE